MCLTEYSVRRTQYWPGTSRDVSPGIHCTAGDTQSVTGRWPLHVRRPALRILAAACLAVLAGCGGSDTPPQPPERFQPAQPDNAPPVPVRTSRAAAGRMAEFDESLATLPAKSSPAIDPDTDPRDVFVIVEQPNFEIISAAPGAHPRDVFHVNVPAAGQDSSTFVVEADASARATSGRPAPGFALPAGFEPLVEAGYSAAGWPRRIRCVADGAEMVLVPAGVCLVGTSDGPPESTPQLSVFLDAFYIDAAEVTLGQYGRFLEERRGTASRALEEPLNRDAPPGFPALGLSWGAAREYAQWAGKELPTEAQWEKAARGPTGLEHPWGNGRAVFARARTRTQIDDVGSFPLDRSPCGALDMAGNAREWCLDFYSDRAFQDAANGATTLSNWPGPRRPSSEYQRVVKGNGPAWKVWHRSGLAMRERRPDVGFRCVLAMPSARPGNAAGDSGSAAGAGRRTRRGP
jgi:formylglycine-generating enzyme